MAMKLNDFLLAYYKQLHFNSMPVEVRAQYDAYAKSDDFRGNMGDWKKTLIDDTGKEKSLPDPTSGEFEIEEKEWEKLFRIFQNAFRSMDANKSSFKDEKKANEFLNEYFGVWTDDNNNTHEKLFTLATANKTLEAEIDSIVPILTKHKNSLSKWLKANGSFFENDSEYDDFLAGLQSKKYNTDAKFQEKLKNIVDYLQYGLTNGAFDVYSGDIKSDLIKISQQFQDIENGFNNNAEIDKNRLNYFKRNYESMLRKLHDDEKVFKVFAEHDNGKISKPLTEAIGKTDYSNKESKDYVPQKRTDELTFGQTISKWRADTYENYLKKFVELRGDRLFFTPEAGAICKAIDGAKIKPTDGLDKVLSEAGKIKENLQYKSPKAAEAFEYFEKTMGELKATMPKAFAGALYDGSQMNAIVSEMILSAVKSGKIEQAKIAMEVLSVIKYGYTTSMIMDTIKKENFSIFSDPNLSWNKSNDAIKFVTMAFDKSLKTAFMGIGYGITIVGNTIKRTGIKYNGNMGRIAKQNEIKSKINEDEKSSLEKTLIKNEEQKATLETDLRKLGRGPGNITDKKLHQRENELVDDKNSIKELEGLLSELNNFKKLDDLKNNLDNDDNYDIDNYKRVFESQKNKLEKLGIDVSDYKKEIKNLEKKLETQKNSVHKKENRINQFHDAKNTLKFLSDQIDNNNKKIASFDEDHKMKYMELMAHWDFLQTGRNIHSWSISKKRAQDKLNAQIDIMDPATNLPMIKDGKPVKKFNRNIILENYYEQYGQKYAA